MMMMMMMKKGIVVALMLIYDSQARENLESRTSVSAPRPFSPGLVTSSVSQQAEQG